MLPETDQHEAFIVAERLRSRFGESFADQPVPLTMSFGVATYPDARRRPPTRCCAPPTRRSTPPRRWAATAPCSTAPRSQGSSRSAARRRRDRDHAQLATVLNLAEALDMRDTGTARHSQTVGRYSELMARELGLPRRAGRARPGRRRAARHRQDRRAGRDPAQAGPAHRRGVRRRCRSTPRSGARILGGSGLDDIREWVLAHHERPDGRGYPRGLADDDIPLEAQILAVADAYEAMTSDRVYRKSIGADAAREELEALRRAPSSTRGRGRLPARARPHGGAGDALRAVVATRQRTRLEPIWTLMSG